MLRLYMGYAARMGLSLEAPLAGVSSGTGEQSTHLLSPKFRGRELGFSALQEWESDISKYEGESGTDQAISHEDKEGSSHGRIVEYVKATVDDARL